MGCVSADLGRLDGLAGGAGPLLEVEHFIGMGFRAEDTPQIYIRA
jgi:hypothetical protein